MANHKSAEKRAGQSLKRKARNRSGMSTLRGVIRSFREGIAEVKAGKKDAAFAQTLLVSAQSALAKAAAKGLIHRNNASRRIGRLAKNLATK